MPTPFASKQEQTIQYLSVTEINQSFNIVLEECFPSLYFEGEVSQVTKASSGHLYLTIKDEKSQLSAVIWRGVLQYLGWVPEQGAAVRCQGTPNVYPATGKLQIILQKISPSGAGALQKRFIELKNKLEKEGLFAPERKRPLPLLPRAVGVVTSASGAVIHDIDVKIKERFPSMPIYLVPVRVQGDGAAEEIASAVSLLNSQKDPNGESLVDVIIVARGGGSLEDLWAFNEEIVVRAIFASKIPVVSGVGHEVDVTLADFVADKRAPTPTAAAELVVPKKSDLLERIDVLSQKFSQISYQLNLRGQTLDELEVRFYLMVERRIQEKKLVLEKLSVFLDRLHPAQILLRQKNLLESTHQRLSRCLVMQLSKSAEMLSNLETRWAKFHPRNRIQIAGLQLAECQRRMHQAFQQQLLLKKGELLACSKQLNALSPLQVLDRGYSIIEKYCDKKETVTSKQTQLVTDSHQLQVGDQLKIRLSRGKVISQVVQIDNKEGGI